MPDAGGTTATEACVFTPRFLSVSKDSFSDFITPVGAELISDLLSCRTLARRLGSLPGLFTLD